jgi:cellulose synthase/poly-beta-1,6-N-acetylglucosamine synthase-like glycosyltransferase
MLASSISAWWSATSSTPSSFTAPRAAAGGWSSDTICDDSDLGLSIMELGWRAHYTNRRYSWRLLPSLSGLIG